MKLDLLNTNIRINMENVNWVVHLEFITVLLTLIGGLYTLDGKIEKQGARTDRLYEMFIDLLKEKREGK